MSQKPAKLFTILGFIVASLALFRDIFAVEFSITSACNSVKENFIWLLPIGVIIGSIIGPWIKSKIINRKTTKNIDVFDLESEGERLSFGKSLEESYSLAKEEIILTGRGFQKDDEVARVIIDRLANKYIELLNKGVKITRIQTHDITTEYWISKYKPILENFSSKFQFYLDIDQNDFVNIALIDPNTENPIVQLLFEVEQSLQSNSTRYAGAVGVFIYGKRELSRSLYKQLLSRLNNTKIVSSNEMNELSLTEKYFAYGSNVDFEQMKKRCPSAKKIGIATLYEYEFLFNVYAPHLKSFAGGIRKAKGQTVSGVVYLLSAKDRKILDDIESPGYYPIQMDIKMNNSQNHSKAIVYLPNEDFVRDEDGDPSENYLRTMINGAKENNLTELTGYLESKIK